MLTSIPWKKKLRGNVLFRKDYSFSHTWVNSFHLNRKPKIAIYYGRWVKYRSVKNRKITFWSETYTISYNRTKQRWKRLARSSWKCNTNNHTFGFTRNKEKKSFLSWQRLVMLANWNKLVLRKGDFITILYKKLSQTCLLYIYAYAKAKWEDHIRHNKILNGRAKTHPKSSQALKQKTHLILPGHYIIKHALFSVVYTIELTTGLPVDYIDMKQNVLNIT